MTRHAVRCSRKAQECPLKAPFMIMIHASYDNTASDIAHMMDVAGSVELVGTFMYVPDILISDQGHLKAYNVHWQVIRDSKGKAKTIRFAFDNDSSILYEHDFSTYMDLVGRNYVISPFGQLYFIERLLHINGIVFFKFIKNVCDGKIPRSDLMHNLWYAEQCSIYQLKYYEYDMGGHSSKLMTQ